MTVPTGKRDLPELCDVAGFRAWHALLKTQVQLSAVLDRELQARTGLALTTYEVLVTLLDAPGRRMRMQDVADAVLLSKSGTTRVVGLLVDDGHVARDIPHDNRRVTYAVLTDAGRKAIVAAMPVLFELVHEHFGRHLTPSDAAALPRILSRIPARHADPPPGRP